MIGRLLYRPLGTLLGMLGGLAASSIFHRIWKRSTGRDDTPDASMEEYGWREVLAGAALHGAVFGTVKAAVDRAGAAGYRRATGVWPSKPRSQHAKN
ncbi:DUF4235 domain-containing protein [Actinoalloteichus hymeniacidonis]|uniref:DUF4235 family protein n=1 Tax=Actinoalloteichus hymeniacidonis TaxID=340345 RepID=A0AAC9HSP8_9PSEU|nr:DUF4235 domain-containing protein [Actinoalloteichus hymeniacidonis]AOS64864.1 putative DUF4235 family protein [Actinoalloteichus hymeniacidonis]MBB5907061.1 hypothetical protein [Actinoalloteichus hymeniacidonis]